MTSRSVKKWLVYFAGVGLGCAILLLFPDKEPHQEHPWHEQTAPEGTYPMTVTDDYGRSLTLEKQPRWLISLAPSITEMLFAMEMGDHLIAVTEWDTYPAKAKELRDQGGNIGALDKPDLEGITALHSDLVIASNLTPAATLDKITQGRTQAISLHHDSFADVLEDIGELGRILGVPGRALALRARLEEERAAVEASLEAVSTRAPRKAVILLSIEGGLQPGWSPGSGTWMGDLIEMAHGENVAAALGSSWGQVSLEGLLAADTDVIFVKDGDSAGARERLRQRIEAVKSHPVWREMRAVREDRIVLLPPGPFSIPGPRMVQAYAEIAAGLWPELDVPHQIAEPDSSDE